jgi:hypothetical protein
MIGKTIATQVTSVLQTTAGKMIFGRFPEEAEAAANAQPVRPDRRSPYEKPPIVNRPVVTEADDKDRVKGR